MIGIERSAHPHHSFVAGGNAERVIPERHAVRFGRGQRGGDHRRAGMRDRNLIRIVIFECVADDAVVERRLLR